MEFQSDSNVSGDAIKLYGNTIEAAAAQAYFCAEYALQRAKASVIFPQYRQAEPPVNPNALKL